MRILQVALVGRHWFIVGCYLPPNDIVTIQHVIEYNCHTPHRAALLVDRDFNTYPEAPETGSIPISPLFLHTFSFELTTKVLSKLSQHIFFFSYLNSAQHNLVVQLCCAKTHLQFCLWSFSKLTYSFVTIELLAFILDVKFNFYFSRELSVLRL